MAKPVRTDRKVTVSDRLPETRGRSTGRSLASIANSRRTRVEPVLNWLRANGEPNWPARLLKLADGLNLTTSPGDFLSIEFEREVAPSPERLAWMFENASRLAPQNGRLWTAYGPRAIRHPRRDAILHLLRSGRTDGIPRECKLEGSTFGDCLIECTQMFIWVEGKRNDWLSPGTKWDVVRDQVARNLEAAWLIARREGRDFCMVICHEYRLKHHEEELLRGYRSGNWNGGWPHLNEEVRVSFRDRLGTVTWSRIAAEWPALRQLGALSDLGG